MGNVIELRGLKAQRQGAPAGRPLSAQFYFDLSCPFSYLAAERVEQAFAEVEWIPAAAAPLAKPGPVDPALREQTRADADRRAATLRVPLVWPELWPSAVPRAMRAAAYAIELGRGAAFVLAAGRLAFCGGYDLEDPVVLAEAAAAAGIDPDECRAAARDTRRDEGITAAGRQLEREQAPCLPALRVAGTLFCGEGRVAEAALAARQGALAGEAG